MIPDELRKILLSPIRPGRVGTDGKGFSHVEAYEIRAHLIRLFDFDGWNSQVIDMQQVFESSEMRRRKNKAGEEYGEPFLAWTVCYRACVQLDVRFPDEDGYHGRTSTFTEWASGTAENQPSRADAHDLALKTAESQALKRCAMNLGDQYGLSLYKKGSKEALVRQTWHSATKTSAEPPSVDEHVTESVPESEQAAPKEDTHEQSAAPTEDPDVDARALRVQDLTAQLLGATSRSAVGGIAAQIGNEKLTAALTFDADENALTLGALLDATLKRVVKSAA